MSNILFVQPCRIEKENEIARAKARIFNLCRTLKETVQQNKNTLSLKFYNINVPRTTDVERSPISLVGLQLQGRSDSILHKLGESRTGWPRGFYIIFSIDSDFVFSNGRSFLIGGFLPKFMNDNIALKRSDLDSLSEMVVTPKLSGSLAMVTCFRLADFAQTHLTYAIAFSKNAMEASSPYVECARDAFSPILAAKPALLADMADNALTICAEGIYPDDPCHGAIPTCDGNEVVITCVSMPGKEPRFVDYMPPRAAMNFCEANALPWSGSVAVRGTELIVKFFTALERKRDEMTWTLYQELIESVDDGENLTHSKAVDHRSVLGETLEGLVVFCYSARDPSGKPSIFKYKFPKYTCRTFGVRPKIKDCVVDVTSRKEFLQDDIVASVVQHATSVIERWTAQPDSDAARRYLKTILLSLYLISDPSWRKAQGTFTPKCQGMLAMMDSRLSASQAGGKTQLAWRPDIHIIAFEEAEALVAKGQVPSELEATLQAAGVFSSRAATTRFHLVCVLGPIGSGKSTIGVGIARKLDLPHVDGDWVLGVLGSHWSVERNDATLSELARCMAEEGGVVLSQGGGVLFDKWQAVVGKLTRALASPCAAAKIELSVVIPAANTSVDGGFEYDESASALREVYLQHDVARVVRERKDRGQEGWADADAAAVKKQSNANLEFACVARDMAGPDNTFFWRYSPTGEPADALPDMDCCARANRSATTGAGTADATLSVTQLRIAAQVQNVKKVKHMTVAVDFSVGRMAVPCGVLGRKDTVLRSGVPISATRVMAVAENITHKAALSWSDEEEEKRAESSSSRGSTGEEEFGHWMVDDKDGRRSKKTEKKRRKSQSLVCHVPQDISLYVLDERLRSTIPLANKRQSGGGLSLSSFAHVTESVGKELQPVMNRDVAIAFREGNKVAAVSQGSKSLQLRIVDEVPSEMTLVGVYAVL